MCNGFVGADGGARSGFAAPRGGGAVDLAHGLKGMRIDF